MARERLPPSPRRPRLNFILDLPRKFFRSFVQRSSPTSANVEHSHRERNSHFPETDLLLDYIPMSKLGMFYNVISTFLLMSQRCGFTVARLFFVPISAKSVPKNILRTKHYFSCQKCCGHFLSTYFK